MSTMAATKQGRRPRGREPGPGAFAGQLPLEASAAKMPNPRRLAAVVVSIYAPCPVSTAGPRRRPTGPARWLTRWVRVRPRRSSFQTSSTSPVRSGDVP